jgi:hypothetical protein
MFKLFVVVGFIFSSSTALAEEWIPVNYSKNRIEKLKVVEVEDVKQFIKSYRDFWCDGQDVQTDEKGRNFVITQCAYYIDGIPSKDRVFRADAWNYYVNNQVPHVRKMKAKYNREMYELYFGHMNQE